jgi:chitinase
MAAVASERTKFVNSVVAFVQQYGFDGLVVIKSFFSSVK